MTCIFFPQLAAISQPYAGREESDSQKERREGRRETRGKDQMFHRFFGGVFFLFFLGYISPADLPARLYIHGRKAAEQVPMTRQQGPGSRQDAIHPSHPMHRQATREDEGKGGGVCGCFI